MQLLAIEPADGRPRLQRTRCQRIEELQKIGPPLALAGSTNWTGAPARPIREKITHNFGKRAVRGGSFLLGPLINVIRN